MGADIFSLIEQIRAGLDGVTPGPWYPGHLADDSSSCNCTSILAENGLMGSIAQVTVDNGLPVGEGGNDGPSFEEAKHNLRHMALMSPDNIRRLLEHIAELEGRTEWRDMESAPKDGTSVLLSTHWGGDEISTDPFDDVQIGYWDAGNLTGDIWHREPGWSCARIGEPIAWMPLPLPSAPKGGRDNG
jgi:hypothetical protein